MPELNSDDEVELRADGTAENTDDEDVESDEEDHPFSDEEGDVTAAVDDDESAPEGTFRPEDNFNTLMEVFRFIVGCNNGAGLSNESTVWLLNLLRDERLDLELIRHWRTLYAVIRFGMALLMSQRQYDTISFTVPGWEGEFQVIRANGREALIKILGNPENADGFVLRPRQVNSAAGRVYTTPETASFWEHAQVAAEMEYGAGAVVVPLILWSDATILSGNERTRVWAVYLSIANIPLRRRWMDCGKLLLAMLPFPPAHMTPAQKVELGLSAKDPNWEERFFLPLLFSYVADYPETCKVSCTQQLGSVMPCSLCCVARDDLRDMDREPAKHRTVEDQEALLRDLNEAKKHSTIPVPSFLWAFNFSRTVWGNTYLSQMPDILHAIYIGFWLYIRSVLRGSAMSARRKDELEYVRYGRYGGRRMKQMYPDARLAGVRSPGSGSYWASGANFTASEHASAMMTVEEVFPREGDGWNLIKVHLLTHVPDAVRRGGLPQEYSAAVYENAHIRTCKLPYRTSNHRQPLQAIAAHNVRASAMGELTSALPARRRNQTALTRAIATGTPQLTLARRSLTARPDHESSAASVFEDINLAVGGLLYYYDTAMRNAGLRPFPAWAHTAVALPAFPTDYGHIRPHYARAAASLHGHMAFSCVEYLSSAGRTVYGRLILLLDAERPLDDSSYEPAEVAVLQRLSQQGLDECTGCEVLGPPSLYRGLTVVPIDRLQRAVHCVPSFEQKDVWFLNKWAYLVNQEVE
ncbi:unnamed protein product [Closterium sp. Naga37s-1]|nr:unnamed protein product [Closterium sp. Naga37s-1]